MQQLMLLLVGLRLLDIKGNLLKLLKHTSTINNISFYYVFINLYKPNYITCVFGVVCYS